MNVAERIDEWQFCHIFQPIVTDYETRTGGPWWKPALYADRGAMLSCMVAFTGIFMAIDIAWLYGVLAILAVGMIGRDAENVAVYQKMPRYKVRLDRSPNRSLRLAYTAAFGAFLYLMLQSVADGIGGFLFGGGVLLSLFFRWSYWYLVACASTSQTP